MRSSLKSTLFSGWNLMRWFRLGLGIAIIFQFIQQKDIFIGMIGVTLLLQAAFNVGCCANGNCSVSPSDKSNTKTLEETTFEEIK